MYCSLRIYKTSIGRNIDNLSSIELNSAKNMDLPLCFCVIWEMTKDLCYTPAFLGKTLSLSLSFSFSLSLSLSVRMGCVCVGVCTDGVFNCSCASLIKIFNNQNISTGWINITLSLRTMNTRRIWFCFFQSSSKLFRYVFIKILTFVLNYMW